MHLTAFANKLQRRLWDWQHLVSTLTFDGPSTVYDTSHLFLLGDLNFRVEAPADLAVPTLLQQLVTKSSRATLATHDQLQREHKAGTIFRGLREGEFWDFEPTYKRIIGDVAGYELRIFCFVFSPTSTSLTNRKVQGVRQAGLIAYYMRHTATTPRNQTRAPSRTCSIPLSRDTQPPTTNPSSRSCLSRLPRLRPPLHRPRFSYLKDTGRHLHQD